jgi:hypothetical protein
MAGTDFVPSMIIELGEKLRKYTEIAVGVIVISCLMQGSYSSLAVFLLNFQCQILIKS